MTNPHSASALAMSASKFGGFRVIRRWHHFCMTIGCAYQAPKRERIFMLGWTLVFLIVALLAGALGFTGIAGAAVGIARVLFFIFLVLFLVPLILRLSAK
jgi:uncharacterized membrane protein YtjA (UPF0391 family)